MEEPRRQDYSRKDIYLAALDAWVRSIEDEGELLLDELFENHKQGGVMAKTDPMFKMQCAEGHEWIETYPTDHTNFGVCPKCTGNRTGRVLFVVEPEEVEPKMKTTSGVFVHQCISPGCATLVEYDDEPCCFKHSPDSGSHLPFYSARERLTQGVTPS